MYSGFSYRMSMTAVPISIRLVLAAIAVSSGNGEASWRSKWWTRTNVRRGPRIPVRRRHGGSVRKKENS